ncbi:hypothetical protein [Peptostreptococcus sp.]|nr:hypothetical protein [Peptostreptococcus sp.]MBF1050115.1 hypothetical protein [Peptostreptococcus sp.]
MASSVSHDSHNVTMIGI